MAALYADSFMSAGPTGIITRSKSEFLKKARVESEFYRRIGQTSARILSLDEIQISEQYLLFNVRWSVTFRKTGDKPIEFAFHMSCKKRGQNRELSCLLPIKLSKRRWKN
jgi:hypothetical protein